MVGTDCLSWGYVWVRRARLDRRVFLQASLELTDDLLHGLPDPTIGHVHVALLLQIGEKVDNLRQGKFLRRVVHVFLPEQVLRFMHLTRTR